MPSDILYYSNYCEHSKKLLQFIAKHNLIEKLNCFNVDKRSRDVNNNQMLITLENGQKVVLPPTVHSVPSLLCVNKNYVVLTGNSSILEYLEPLAAHVSQSSSILRQNDEPISYSIEQYTANSNIVSEKFTDYNASPEVFSAKSTSKERKLHNYVGVDSNLVIQTPEETYKPDKVSADVTIDKLQQQRNDPRIMPPTFLPTSLSAGMETGGHL
jgi:hypothetical protein